MNILGVKEQKIIVLHYQKLELINCTTFRETLTNDKIL